MKNSDMDRRLFDAYQEAVASGPTADGALNAVVVPGRAHDYVSAGDGSQPVILLSCSSPAELRRPPISLQHVTVEFGIRFRVRTSSSDEEGHFVVVSLRGGDQMLAEPFCTEIEALIAALPSEPSASDIERVVRQFVELMSTLSLPSSRAVAGLWAELWLMTVADDPRAAVAAWHEDATDRFDFAFPGHQVEVKATERADRNHEFSFEQLRRSELPTAIASLKLRHLQSGKSISDLVEILQGFLTAEMRPKVVRNVFSALGSEVAEASEMRFDEGFAEANLRVIAASNVPVVSIPDGSPISSVRFRVNLDDTSVAADLVRPRAAAALHQLV
ncbi:PD-(D/E)XK motif protein [Burkholderia gladioli]|uniref:PD-(D/E)XK motif protein n=1 Tax=Burkholderia gladioli TaxID=28095 RepID=UPI0013F60683|nr:PD-(D/E)XK motif protein [Burkholderia gladioli]